MSGGQLGLVQLDCPVYPVVSGLFEADVLTETMTIQRGTRKLVPLKLPPLSFEDAAQTLRDGKFDQILGLSVVQVDLFKYSSTPGRLKKALQSIR